MAYGVGYNYLSGLDQNAVIPAYQNVPGAVSGAPPIAMVGAPSALPVASVQAPTDITGVAAAQLSQALQPYFNQQQQQLEAQLAAKGLWGSGAGSQQLQDLTAFNNATFANAMLPILQQQNQLQSSAASQNANAINSYNALLTQLGAQGSSQNAAASNAYLNALMNLAFQGALSNAQMDLASQQTNEQLLAQLALANQGLMASPYLTELQQIGGLYGTGLGTAGGILGQGANNAFSGYLAGENALTNALAGIGQGAGMYFGARSVPASSVSPFSFDAGAADMGNAAGGFF